MNVLRFQARDSAQAIRQIRSQLGAEAIVLSVTPVPVKGLGRLWRRPGLEVLAGLPEPEPAQPGAPAELRNQRAGEHYQELRDTKDVTGVRGQAPRLACSGPKGEEAFLSTSLQPGCRLDDTDIIRQHQKGLPLRPSPPPVSPPGQETAPHDAESATAAIVQLTLTETDTELPLGRISGAAPHDGWRTAAMLQQMGLRPLCIDAVLERARASCGGEPPASLAKEFELVRAALASFWRTAVSVRVKGAPPLHVFVGAPGCGKTTVLCKWLAKSVLAENLKPRAWRLDSRAANFAGLLDFYSEILGVALEREWRPLPAMPGFDLGFIDLPGTNPQDLAALQQLRQRVESIPKAQVHLVLNAAYEIPVLLSQVRAFASLPVSDLILTHMDEEQRRGKLWNLVLGTNLPVRFLSGGQNIPGDFSPATPDRLFSR